MNAPLPLHLLVVDDDDVDRERVLRLLRGSPFAVQAVQAASGAEAMALLRDQRFDCVVLDQHLGDTTGAELLVQLRNEARTDCPVIMVTGAGSEALAVQALQEGAADYLSKPQLNAEGLVRSIERSLERQQLKRELALLHRELERRVDEQAATIRRRERELHDILDNAPAMIGYWDAGLHLRLANKAYIEGFALPPDRLPGLPIHEALAPDHLEASRPHIEAALGGEPQRFERVMGGRCLQVEYRPDRTEDGQILGFYATVIDITPVKAAQARAEELLRFSEAVIHAAPVGISVYHADGRCVITNAEAARLEGLSLEAMRLRNIRQTPVWRDNGLLAEADAVLTDGLPRQFELGWAPGEGPRLPHMELLLSRVDRGGQPHLLVMARDITEQRLALDALISARDAAEDAARTKAAFLANMSHEIRTPMNAIIGLSRLTLDDGLPDQARIYVDKLHASAVALMGILDDVLDYSKIEAGQLRFEQLPLDLGELLQRVEGLFIARIEQKGLVLHSTVGPGVPQRLIGDALRLSQVLNNLVGNAVKFTEQGHVGMAVTLEEPPTEGRVLLRFEVTDTGMGISPEQQAALFEAFSQGDSSITRRFGGSGLGLAICKRLVELMGGQIGVASAPGSGSRFWFTARLALADEAAAAVAPAPGPQRVASPVPAALPPGLRILLVEDNELNQIVASQFLRRMGAEVDLATDGAQAVARVQQAGPGHYAALLMDLHMPVMGGLEATRRIHALPGHAGLPVIGMTAAAMPEDRANCLAAGMLSHVPKPVMPERLLQAIREALPGVLGGSGGLPPAGGPPLAAAAGTAAAAQRPTVPIALDEPAIDLPALRRRLSNNQALLERLLDLFAQREAQVVDELADSLARGDLQAASLRAHDLKGSAATLCAMPVSRAAAALESALKQGQSPAPALGALAEAMGRLTQALARLRAAPPRG